MQVASRVPEESFRSLLFATSSSHAALRLHPHFSFFVTLLSPYPSSFSFPLDRRRGELLGLPGRVFTSGRPEWTPNVQFYSPHEFLRVNHATRCAVRGSLAAPVFAEVEMEAEREDRGQHAGTGEEEEGEEGGGREVVRAGKRQGRRECVAVVEVVTMAADVRFGPQLDSICSALHVREASDDE